MTSFHNISDVSRITGIPKDLLRMWERRYGYPNPERDSNGDRIYSSTELDKLIVIRQLVSQGKRPGKLMALDISQLRTLLQSPKVELDTDHLVALLAANNMIALHEWLQKQLAAYGLRAFIYNVMSPATEALGEAWANGVIQVYQEHLYTETMKSLVRQALTEHYHDSGEPRVMLTTIQGEPHSLGLLMVESLLRIDGAEVISFGTEMPIGDIKKASASHNVDVLGLSFSCHFKNDEAMIMLGALRQQIDRRIAIWVGGAAFYDRQTMPEGVKLIDGLREVEVALADWRQLESNTAGD